MSFGVADLITAAVIEDGLQHLRRNPGHLNFILSPFCRFPQIRSLVGAKYISQAVEYITNNQLYVAPYYEADHTKIPSVVTVARTGEDQQFIGDMGFYQPECKIFDPIEYGTFDIVGLEQDRRVLFVPEAAKVEDMLWPNIWLRNGDFKVQVRGVHTQKGKDTRILLNSRVPEGTNYKGWVAQSSERRFGYEVHSNIEAVEVNCKLTTSGDYSLHRLMAIVTRYCLKRGRFLFESYGFQAPKISQGMAVLENGGQDAPAIFTTVFSVNGKLGEHWIANEFEYGNASGKIDMCDIAVSEGKADVPLE